MKSSRLTLAALFALFAPLAIADQSALQVPVTGPHSEADLNSNFVNPALKSLAGCNWGTTAPVNFLGAPTTGECWINTGASPWNYEIYDGASWVTVYTINSSTHASSVPAASLTGSALPSGITSAPGLQSFGAAINFNQFAGNTTSNASVGSGGSLANSNGTFVTVITATGSATFGLTFPTAANNGWACPSAVDITTNSTTNFVIKQTTPLSTTAASFAVYSDAAAAGATTAGDKILVTCIAF